jgi:hypothetical protein
MLYGFDGCIFGNQRALVALRCYAGACGMQHGFSWSAVAAATAFVCLCVEETYKGAAHLRCLRVCQTTSTAQESAPEIEQTPNMLKHVLKMLKHVAHMLKHVSDMLSGKSYMPEHV